MDLSKITPVTQDYLKVIWSATEWGDPPITTTGLAERFGTTAPSVSETLRRLGDQELNRLGFSAVFIRAASPAGTQ